MPYNDDIDNNQKTIRMQRSYVNLNLKMLAQLSILDKATFSYILQDIKVK